MTTDPTLEIIRKVLLVVLAFAVLINIVRFALLEYRRHKNRNAPVFTDHATVWYKHSEVDAPYLGRGYSYVHFITFHTQLGEAVKLYLNPDDFYILNEGDTGELTWQGEKFWRFVPDQKEVPHV